MSELAQVMSVIKNAGLNVIQYPSGKWGFVGKVPVELAFEYSDIKYVDMARQHGLGIARPIAKKEGGFIDSRVFDTFEAAQAAMEGI